MTGRTHATVAEGFLISLASMISYKLLIIVILGNNYVLWVPDIPVLYIQYSS